VNEPTNELQAPTPSWEDIILLLAGATLIVVLLPTLGAWLRGSIARSTVSQQGFVQSQLSRLEHSLGHLHAAMLFLVFISSVLLVVLTLGRGYVLEGLALATGLTLFAGLHIPHLLPPAIHVNVSISDDGIRPSEFSPEAQLPENRESLLFFRVTNIGACHYKSCTCWIWFPHEVSVTHDLDRYTEIDFRKEFSFQRGNNCLCYQPSKNGLDLTPGNHFVFPVLLKASHGRFDAHLEIDTESRWGATKKKVALNF
jgi:hypothetical protein